MRWWVRERSGPELQALIDDPDSVLGGAGSVARERAGRKRFYRVEGSPALYVKVFHPPSGLARLRPSRAKRELQAARAVASKGFDAAVPVAVGEDRTFGMLNRAIAVIEERDARDLRSLLLDPATPRERRRALVESFGALNRALHDAGVDQDDTSPNNFLVDADGNWTLIDFERCSVGATLGERRWTLLAKLHRHDLGVSRTDRLRFLRAYLGEEGGRREAWDKVRAAFAEVRRNDARRAAAGAFQIGRNVGRDGDAWFVKGREHTKVERIEAPPEEAKRLWILAHQLERLKLPALRPVRLSPDGLELEAPQPDGPEPSAIARSRRELQVYGTLTGEPDWALQDGAAVLRNLAAYELQP